MTSLRKNVTPSYRTAGKRARSGLLLLDPFSRWWAGRPFCCLDGKIVTAWFFSGLSARRDMLLVGSYVVIFLSMDRGFNPKNGVHPHIRPFSERPGSGATKGTTLIGLFQCNAQEISQAPTLAILVQSIYRATVEEDWFIYFCVIFLDIALCTKIFQIHLENRIRKSNRILLPNI